MKIFAIGLNYASHNKEMKRTFESEEPVLFMKPDTALLKNGKPFMLPDFSDEIHYETEIVVKLSRLGKILESVLLIVIMTKSRLGLISQRVIFNVNRRSWACPGK